MLPHDLPDEFDDEFSHQWSDGFDRWRLDRLEAARDERIARRIQWALIAAFVVVVIAGLSVA